MTFTSSGGNFSLLVAEEQLETLRLNRLYRDWRQVVSGGALPDAAFIDPQRLAYLDGMLVIVDVERPEAELRRYRYRSVGRHFIDHLKVDPAGTYMDQHPESDFAAQAIRACDLVVQTRRPIHARIDRDIEGRRFMVEFLLLPLAGPGNDHDHGGGDEVATVLIAQIFTPAGA